MATISAFLGRYFRRTKREIERMSNREMPGRGFLEVLRAGGGEIVIKHIETGETFTLAADDLDELIGTLSLFRELGSAEGNGEG